MCDDEQGRTSPRPKEGGGNLVHQTETDVRLWRNKDEQTEKMAAAKTAGKRGDGAEAYGKLKVIELRSRLEALGESAKGKKAELVERLAARMAREARGGAEDAAGADVAGEGPGATAEETNKMAEMAEMVVEETKKMAETTKMAEETTKKKRPASPRPGGNRASDQAPTPSSNKKPKKDEECRERKQRKQGHTSESVDRNRNGGQGGHLEEDMLAEFFGDGEGSRTYSSVTEVYESLLGGGKSWPKKDQLQNLEFYGYLERCLVPMCEADEARLASPVVAVSIMMMLNEKFLQALPSWDAVTAGSFPFPAFFESVLSLVQGDGFSDIEAIVAVSFLSNCVQSLENSVVRGQVMKVFGIGMWWWIPEERRQVELQRRPELLVKKWRHVLKKDEKSPGYFEAVQTRFFPWVVDRMLGALLDAARGHGGNGGDGGDGDGSGGSSSRRFVEVALGLVVDVLSQLPTRRFAWTYLRRRNFLPKARLALSKGGCLPMSTISSVAAMMAVDVDNLTGEVITIEDSMREFYATTQQVQRLFFKYWQNLKDVSFLSAKELSSRAVMAEYLGRLSDADMKDLVCDQLKLATPGDYEAYGRALLEEVFAEELSLRASSKRTVEDMPVYPTEALILNPMLIPEDKDHSMALAVPKINVQFLSLPEYLERNFKLYLMEAGYDVRQHLVGVVRRMAPYLNDEGRVEFSGWSAMGVEVSQPPKIVDVRPADVGWNFPSRVLAEVRFTTRGMQNRIKVEWDQLREHDILLLVTFKDDADGLYAEPASRNDRKKSGDLEFLASRIQHIRGCEIKSIRDEEGSEMNAFGEDGAWMDEAKGFSRTATVEFDPVQYHQDDASGNASLYTSFQLIVRRNAKENNFKSVLKSIRDALIDEGNSVGGGRAVLPAWLSDTFLGYGDPKESTCLGDDNGLPKRLTLDYQDTFVSERHVSECFPGHDIEWVGSGRCAPFKVTFHDDQSLRAAMTAYAGAGGGADLGPRPKLKVEGSCAIDDGRSAPNPTGRAHPRVNTTVEFTAAQVAAITRSLQPGLSLIVGPPGSGKTDTAVQILHTLYHNDPSERTLIITHSNQALNDIFQKLASKDIDVGEMIRLGYGESLLETEEEYDKLGRVNAMLERRMHLLNEVQKLGESLGVMTSTGSDTDLTCETSASFWKLHVLPRWEKHTSSLGEGPEGSAVEFPFKAFAESRGLELKLEPISRIFDELQSLRPFEVLTRQGDRIRYMLTKQAKVIAMTCTHAAIKRQEFLDLKFAFDNILMEESAQVLDVESILPLTMQVDTARLKRVVLIGDHNQLPPVVTNPLLKNHCRFEQSLFARLIRLNAPHVELSAQGRARAGIAALYSWRYKHLDNLSRTSQCAYALANPGFAYEYQFVDVPDFGGRGESQPQPHFYQNLGEAEYIVLVYQYMRLLGYGASRISVLTTYNGQCALLKDVFTSKCSRHPLFGMPAAISTVDKFQGQQNDFILLSLVRTNRIGHIRDVRRLVVALSRARLGLYVFGRMGMFDSCQEIQCAMQGFKDRPAQLALVEGEYHGMEQPRKANDVPGDGLLVGGVQKMADIVKAMESESMRLNKL